MDHRPEVSIEEKHVKVPTLELEGVIPTKGAHKAHVATSESDVLGRHYLAFLHNLSPLTAKTYARDIIEFFAFVKAFEPITTPSELKRSHLIFFRQDLEKRGLGNKTILKKLSAVSSFCRFLASENLIDKDIVYGVKRPRSRNKKETADLSDADVRKLFDGMKKDRAYYVHHRALLAVGFYTGLRSSEIRHLKVKDYAKVDGHMILTCIIKGDKNHEIPLNPFVVRCLDAHIERLGELGFLMQDPGHHLFPSIKTRTNKPMQDTALASILRNRLKDAGIELSAARRYSPHSMRATLAGHLLNTVEAPLEQVQQALGHSSPSTTQKYNKRTRSHDKSPVYCIDY